MASNTCLTIFGCSVGIPMERNHYPAAAFCVDAMAALRT